MTTIDQISAELKKDKYDSIRWHGGFEVQKPKYFSKEECESTERDFQKLFLKIEKTAGDYIQKIQKEKTKTAEASQKKVLL